MINFTRASTATYIDTGGVLRVAQVNEPRFEESGILIEGGSTNYAFGKPVTSGGSTVDKPLLGYKGYEFSSDTSEGIHGLSFTSQKSGIEEVVHTTSAYVYPKNIRFLALTMYDRPNVFIQVNFDLTTGKTHIFNPNADPTSITCKMEHVGSGVIKLSISGRVGVKNAKYGAINVRYIPTLSHNALTSFVGTVGAGFDVMGVQLEELPFATSYIPTDEVPVTRAADSLYLPKGTLEMNTSNISIFGDAVSYTKGEYAYSHWLYAGSSTPVEFGYKSKILYAKYGVDPNVVVKEDVNYSRMGITYDRGSKTLKAYSGNNVGSYDYNSLPNDIGDVFIGGREYKWFGHIKNFRVWNKVLTQNQISLLQGVV